MYVEEINDVFFALVSMFYFFSFVAVFYGNLH